MPAEARFPEAAVQPSTSGAGSKPGRPLLPGWVASRSLMVLSGSQLGAAKLMCGLQRSENTCALRGAQVLAGTTVQLMTELCMRAGKQQAAGKGRPVRIQLDGPLAQLGGYQMPSVGAIGGAKGLGVAGASQQAKKRAAEHGQPGAAPLHSARECELQQWFAGMASMLPGTNCHSCGLGGRRVSAAARLHFQEGLPCVQVRAARCQQMRRRLWRAGRLHELACKRARWPALGSSDRSRQPQNA